MILVPASAQQTPCPEGRYPMAVSGTLTLDGIAVTTNPTITAKDQNGASLTPIGTPTVSNGFLTGTFCVLPTTTEIKILVGEQELSPAISLNTYTPKAIASGGSASGQTFNIFNEITSFISTLAIRPATGVSNFLVDIFGGLKVQDDIIVGEPTLPEDYATDGSSDLFVEGDVVVDDKSVLKSGDIFRTDTSSTCSSACSDLGGTCLIAVYRSSNDNAHHEYNNCGSQTGNHDCLCIKSV